MKSRFTALLSASALILSACAESPVISEPTTLTRDGGIAFNSAAAEAGNTYLVRFNGNGVPADFASSVAALGGEVIFAHAGVGIAAIAGITDAGANGLAARSDVAGVDADTYTTVENPGDLGAADETMSPAAPATAFFFPRQWHLQVIGAPQAWAAGKLGSSTTKVGILDTGLGYTHADLAGRVDLANSVSFVPSDNALIAANFPPGTHPIADMHFHGTHVGATVASNALAAAGVTSMTTLVGIKVCSAGGSCPTSAVLTGILYASDLGLPVINMSLGSLFLARQASARGGNGPSLLATINAVFHYANKKGTTVVVAAGNDAFDLQRDFGHGAYGAYCDAPEVICVSATGPTSRASINGPWFNIDALAGYSNRGTNHITVAAPGGNGASSVTAACSPFALGGLAICQTGTFVVGSNGTSMASPHVAGLAALIAAEGGHTPASIARRIIDTADDLGDKGKDAAYGSGRINVARALGLQ